MVRVKVRHPPTPEAERRLRSTVMPATQMAAEKAATSTVDNDNDSCSEASTVAVTPDVPVRQREDAARSPRPSRPPRTFPCPHCDKVFPQPSGLLYHSGLHEDPRPFPCFDCPKSYHLEHLLIHHEKKHFKYKPYACDECGKRFRWKISRRQHAKYAHSDPSFACPLCDEMFLFGIHLYKHKLEKHAVAPAPGKSQGS